MKRVSKLVENYYDKRIKQENLFEASFSHHIELPIKAEKKSEWVKKLDPSRLCRTYELAEEDYNNFVADLLDFQADLYHHAKITLEFPEVHVEVWTHDLRDITEIDQKWAKKADQIFKGYNS